MMLKVNDKFIGPDILVCEKCSKVDNYYIIKPNKHIYQVCDKCGHEKDKGLINAHNLKALSFKIVGGKR